MDLNGYTKIKFSSQDCRPCKATGEIIDAAPSVTVYARGGLAADETRCLRLNRDEPQLGSVRSHAERVYLEAA